MVLNKKTRKIIFYIIVFPPIALLLYAIVSYFLFFNFKNDVEKTIINENTINYYEKIDKYALAYRIEIIKKVLKRSNSLNSFLNYHLKFLLRNKDLKLALINDDGKILYPYKYDNRLKNFYNLIEEESFYGDKNFIAYASRFRDLKVILYYDLNRLKEKNFLTKKELNDIAKKLFFKSIIILVVIWFFIIILSTILAFWVFKVLKNYEKSLEDTNRNIVFQSRQALLGELLPMIAHQWRQPLNKIASVLMRMRFEILKGTPDANELDRQCQAIENSVELMSNTIDDFRDFYRPKEKPELTDLSIIVRKAIYFLDELLDKKKINISTNLSHVTVELHSNVFLQVVINLIKNASDAVEENGHIDITLREKDDNLVEFKIEDDGTGIPQDKLEKIFDAHESTKQGSMGLGLYMSKLIVESHFKGKIQAYNTPKGAGFIIIIPKKQKNS